MVIGSGLIRRPKGVRDVEANVRQLNPHVDIFLQAVVHAVTLGTTQPSSMSIEKSEVDRSTSSCTRETDTTYTRDDFRAIVSRRLRRRQRCGKMRASKS
jgi:hypothetical protein